MQLKKLLSLFFTALSLTAAAQKNITVTGSINNLHNEKVFFRFYTGSRATYSDSVITENGSISFSIPDSLRGLAAIRVHSRPNFVIRLITNGEAVLFHANTAGDTVQIISSEENKNYDQYRKQKNTAALKADHSPAAVFAQMQIPVTAPEGTADAARYMREHFLDNTDLGNEAIIHTDLLWPQLFSYIQLYDNGDMPFTQQIDTLCTGLDKLLKRATNEQVYNFLVEDLCNRFRYGNYDILCAYLTKYYTSRYSIAKDYPVSGVRERLSKVKHPTIGQTAPEIIMDAPGGGSSKMTDIKADYLLIVFWSTGCSHCIQSIPLLKKIYDARRSGFEVLSISTDTDSAPWQAFIKEHGLGWINYSELKGWEGNITKDYDVQGTPTYILLDQNKTIISKPVELQDLAAELQRLKII